jgi:hypothetical protein
MVVTSKFEHLPWFQIPLEVVVQWPKYQRLKTSLGGRGALKTFGASVVIVTF